MNWTIMFNMYDNVEKWQFKSKKNYNNNLLWL